MTRFAVVAVDDPHARPGQAHHYSVPECLAPTVAPGRMVVVPFGRRLRRGWFLASAEESPVEETKPLAAVLTEAPPLHERQVALARWVSRRGHVPLAQALALALPSGLLDAYLPRLRLAAKAADVGDDRWALARPLLTRPASSGPLRLDRAWTRLPACASEVLPELERAGIVVRASPSATPTGAPTASHAGTIGPVRPDRLTSQMCSAVFADLTNRRGSVFLVTSATWPLAGLEQLVHHVGVSGGQALLMVPQPARQRGALAGLLTRFPDSVVLTGPSHLRRLLEARPLLTIGGQWAALAPLPNLALVVVLDEHDSAYVGQRPPRMHGREVALQAARLAGATVVLISPTPDPGTLWRAQRAAVRRFSLAPPPLARVDLVDVRQELRAGRESLLTTPLCSALAEALAGGGRALLLLNRRGSAVVLMCHRCGAALHCRRCSAALAYHGDEKLVRCHFCNNSEPRPELCPRCGTPSLHELGAGVQRLAQEVRTAFPRARLGRWDRDAAAGQAADAALVRAFAARELDVLVGTQLVALREDLPPVELAVAALADVGLHLPYYRAAERTFELLSALRRRVSEGGRLIIQTYHPTHWVMQAVGGDDPALFYGEELRRRRELGFPPFRQLVRLTCRANSRQRCEAEAWRLRDALLARLATVALEQPDALLGPAPAYVEQVRGIYRWQLYLRGPHASSLLDLVPPHWLVEVDPEGL